MIAAAIYGNHDSNLCIQINNKYLNFEFERYMQRRYYMPGVYNNEEHDSMYQTIYDILKNEHGVEKIDVLYHQSTRRSHIRKIKTLWDIKQDFWQPHHISHAASTFYQSMYNKALVFSYDGGGPENDGKTAYFKVFVAERNSIKEILNIPYNIGIAYGMAAEPIKEIKKPQKLTLEDFMKLAGKLMGLASYGNYDEKYAKIIRRNMTSDISIRRHARLDLPEMEGQKAWDLACTTQVVFEEVMTEIIVKVAKEYDDLPICLTGGCAMNVLFNNKIRMLLGRSVYVAPNPGDCGLPFGMLAYNNPPNSRPNLMYSGWPILDIEKLDAIKSEPIDPRGLAEFISKGNIVGVMRGNSEHGPRALGNRSILCDPGVKDMKDILNAKVKFREWFRPFAPMVCVDKVSEYFEFSFDSPYMSFAPEVKEEWKDKLPSVTHVDGTSRLQTVNRRDNAFIFDTIKEFGKIKGYDVLINTSLNVRGKPITTTIEECMEILNTTKIDAIVVEDRIIKREQNGSESNT